MPIYAYKCDACGHQHDHLQKLSDPLLTDCPQCGKPEYRKMLTAAGFQLKGSGWYVTDFRNNGGSGGKSADKKDSKDNSGDSAGGDKSTSTDNSTSKSDAGSATSTPASTTASTTTTSTTSGSAGSGSSAAAA